MASSLVATQMTHPVAGESVVLTTNTALVYTRTTDTNPMIMQSVTSCNTTSVQSNDGPYIASHSEILIQRQNQLEEDCYNLLHYIMMHRLTNMSETLTQHDNLHKFYLTLKGFIKNLDSQDKNIHLALCNSKKIKVLLKSIFQHIENKQRQMDVTMNKASKAADKLSTAINKITGPASGNIIDFERRYEYQDDFGASHLSLLGKPVDQPGSMVRAGSEPLVQHRMTRKIRDRSTSLRQGESLYSRIGS